ncbi:hypothetical protein Poli38472_010374 [Pythium oligandrum]|uniref:Uncharacterized protein n=1 Tax=Pythium oligandrum TaxID=41045 RepID=A0A8K1C2Y9_PYTOL|nr:hypothetical protein Poli38472_010374 [Pythium oligandrum]|eukprot:TMW55492.1 hypothetical protein Poli38472_010374 [Pythium oligandrum]
MLPMMIPLRIRNQNNQDTLYAQQRYSPCRYTTLSPRGDAAEDDDGGRGPGSLALDELNTMAGNTERKRCSLYSSDRDVTPTVLPAVDTIYHSEKLHALTNLVEKQGNMAITLQSPTPRFETPSSPSPHPGAYSPERFVGAFPILLDKVTPQSESLL